jgi:CubicO group peptidase (beta-lactamase class C family)
LNIEVRHLFLIIGLFFCLSTSIKAENDTIRDKVIINKPISNQERHYDTFIHVETEVTKLLDHYGITGASMAIVRDGNLLYTKGYGYADKENDIKTLPQHQFRIASVSKLITAVAVFKLIEANVLSLDQQVFGEGGVLDKAIYKAHIYDERINSITIRHLLTHSAGWNPSKKGDPMFNPLLVTEGNDIFVDANLTNLISFALKQGLQHYPGRESHYFNLGYCMLGEIIATVSGTSYEEYVQKAILEPLRIESMALGKNMKKDKLPNEVVYYDYHKRNSFTGSGKLVPRPYGGTPIELLGPSGGWVANIIDLMKLLNAIDGHDSRPDFLSEESVKEMTKMKAGILPMGWIAVGKNDDWLRTGTLAGSHALFLRKSNGINYGILANSSTERSHNFSKEMYVAIERGIKKVNYWPDYDLFESLKKEFMVLQKSSHPGPIQHNLYSKIPQPIPEEALLTQKN